MIREKIKNSSIFAPIKYCYQKYKFLLPVGKRYGKSFSDTCALLDESEYWSEDKIKEYQLYQLKSIIKHAHKNCPYYTKLFNEYSIHPDDIKDMNDMKKIPYLTKEIINQYKNEMIDVNFPKKYLGYGTTGGSTGIPMGFYFDKRIYSSIEWAYMTHQWKRVGYKHRDKCVVLRGNVVGNIKENKRYWEMDRTNNWLIMSSYHLTDETIPLYIKKIRGFSPKYIQAYPSALKILMSYMENHHIKPFVSIKAVLCGSENIYNWQRILFEKILNTRVYSWYGHSEQVCLAGECEVSSKYHSFPTYGFTELINANGDWCIQEGEKGEIVATGFTNYVMPFIRYRTQDIAINTNKKCECGRNWKLIKSVEGRLQDYVIGRNNENITLTALIFSQHFKAFSKIKNMQLIQNKTGEVVIRIVENEKLQDDDKKEIITKMENASDNSLQISIKFVNEIPRTKSGKYRFLIQELPVEFK